MWWFKTRYVWVVFAVALCAPAVGCVQEEDDDRTVTLPDMPIQASSGRGGVGGGGSPTSTQSPPTNSGGSGGGSSTPAPPPREPGSQPGR
ncbi:MAG: hypothetical protein AAFX99_13305 [Myxococcota bacterium]